MTAPVRARASARVAPDPVRRTNPQAIPTRRPTRRRAPAPAPVPARRKRGRLLAVAAGVVAAASLFALAGFHAMLVSGQARLDQLDAQASVEEDRYAAQRMEVAALEAPHRVVSEATARLGMVTAATPTYLAPSQEAVDAVRAGGGRTARRPAPREDQPSWAATKSYLSAGP